MIINVIDHQSTEASTLWALIPTAMIFVCTDVAFVIHAMIPHEWLDLKDAILSFLLRLEILIVKLAQLTFPFSFLDLKINVAYSFS